MPLTFAHPAAILLFPRRSKYFYFSALVLGSMAPDFEYFLRGQPGGVIGHTFAGLFYFNLPLVICVYWIYRQFIRQNIINHLPSFLQDTNHYEIAGSKAWKSIVFCYSALLGMLTHVIWDAFTHRTGFVVERFPILSETYGLPIPIYKLLQHGSTILGLTLILIYLYYRASISKNKSNISPKRKFAFGSVLAALTLIYVSIWGMVAYIPFSSYGVWVVRMIDSFFFSILTLSTYLNVRKASC
ncbi:DUF4184 family protein [Metasolibacillus meyeri]|uniref:DUF4184 family protein n=1 Tax=Metasolibacillus meyeri TaxID=1071052 RepID=UPI000D3067C7|nr:DUF4184 family protein [Metasolibacillus meyeri]